MSPCVDLFTYCGNNPISRSDEGGQFWDTVLDVASLAFSIVDVAMNPDDPWAWIGLAGDVIDLIPFVTCVGEVAKSVRAGVKVADAVWDVTKVADDVHDVAKTFDNITDVSEEIADTAGDISKQCLNQCFVAGTLISTETGHVKIEDITVGDKVWAANPETDEKALKEVAQTFINETYISAIECYRRSISLENIQRIADALEIDTYKLFLEE